MTIWTCSPLCSKDSMDSLTFMQQHSMDSLTFVKKEPSRLVHLHAARTLWTRSPLCSKGYGLAHRCAARTPWTRSSVCSMNSLDSFTSMQQELHGLAQLYATRTL